MGLVSVGFDMTMGASSGSMTSGRWLKDMTAVCESEVLTEDQGTQLEEG